jgi:hypothetical protein
LLVAGCWLLVARCLLLVVGHLVRTADRIAIDIMKVTHRCHGLIDAVYELVEQATMEQNWKQQQNNQHEKDQTQQQIK